MDASITKPNLHLISLLILFLVISLHSNASNIKNLAIKDLAYGNHPLQKLDVYQSSNASNAPILFMVHGGAWRRGDKAAKAVVKNKVDRWIAKGFIFISINYRLLPEADPFKQADDVATALKFVQSNASQWGGDPSQIILMGHSAGAHLINILSASSTIKAAHELMPWLATISIDSAVFNVERTMQRKHFRFYDRAFGNDKDYWRSVSPFHLLKTPQPPILAICSTVRRDNACDNAKRFASKAQSSGTDVEVLEINLSHRDINAKLGLNKAYTRSVEKFMRGVGPTITNLLN